MVASMREAHELCDEHHDVATASLLENYIDEPKSACGSSTRAAAEAIRPGTKPVRTALQHTRRRLRSRRGETRGGRAQRRRGPMTTSASPRRHARRPRPPRVDRALRQRQREQRRAGQRRDRGDGGRDATTSVGIAARAASIVSRWLGGKDDAFDQHEARAEFLMRPGQHRVPMLRLPRHQSRRRLGAIAQQIGAEIFRHLVGHRRGDDPPPRRSPHWPAASAASLPDRSLSLARPIPARSLRPARASAPPACAAPASSPACRRAEWQSRPRPHRRPMARS